MINKHPRFHNLLHALFLAKPWSETIGNELDALAAHAHGKRSALEIGTFQAVSAVRIAKSLAPEGLLYCVDPWPDMNGKADPCWSIAQRHLKRSKVNGAVRILKDLSKNITDRIPASLDFAFIDGDHTWEGIETDWRIVAPRIQSGGILCLHDAVTPSSDPKRVLESMKFFNEVVLNDPGYELLEVVHSLAVLRRR